nr:hypothetical protein [Sulfitobacter algicola]
MQVTTIGLDLAKNVFQVHGITREGTVAFNRSLRRAQMFVFFEKLEPCLIGMEACGSSHYWARELSKLGHTVKLIAPIYVKPYVKRGNPMQLMRKRFARLSLAQLCGSLRSNHRSSKQSCHCIVRGI